MFTTVYTWVRHWTFPKPAECSLTLCSFKIHLLLRLSFRNLSRALHAPSRRSSLMWLSCNIWRKIQIMKLLSGPVQLSPTPHLGPDSVTWACSRTTCMCILETRWQPYRMRVKMMVFVCFSLNSLDRKRKDRIVNWTAVSIYWIWSALLNAVLICYWRNKIHEFCRIFEGFVICRYIMTLFCTLVTRQETRNKCRRSTFVLTLLVHHIRVWELSYNTEWLTCRRIVKIHF